MSRRQPIGLLEGEHRRICTRTGNDANDYCVTQDEDNNHDEINYYRDPKGELVQYVKCDEDKILKGLIEEHAGVFDNFQIVAVKTQSILVPRGQEKKIFNEFIDPSSSYTSFAPGLTSLREIFSLQGIGEVVSAALDTKFNPINAMFYESIQCNFFDSATSGVSQVAVDFIMLDGKHFWVYLVDEMFRYCEETSNKKKIHEYLMSWDFERTVPAGQLYIKVKLPYTDERIDYVVSNPAIQYVVYDVGSRNESPQQNFLRALKADFVKYCKATGIPYDEDMYFKVCKYLKYSGDQANILQM